VSALSDDWSALANELASRAFFRAVLLCTAFAAVVSRGNGSTRVITVLYLVDLYPSDHYVLTCTKISWQNLSVLWAPHEKSAELDRRGERNYTSRCVPKISVHAPVLTEEQNRDISDIC